MKKNNKQGDFFDGFKPEKEPITVKDVCKTFNGEVVTEKEAEEETRLLKMEREGRGGEELVKLLCEKGVFWWVKSDKERVEWYKKVFAEDEEKRGKKMQKKQE